MTIADTDVLIDYPAGRGKAEGVEALIRRGTLRTTVINRFELLSSARNSKQHASLLQLLDAVPSLVLDGMAADAASQMRRSLERSGLPIGLADSLIAGIAVSKGGALLTRKRRHFERRQAFNSPELSPPARPRAPGVRPATCERPPRRVR